MDQCNIWNQLPIELIAIILEWMCIIKIRERLIELECGFLTVELQKHDAFLAGSFILQCALGETYNTDIDVFIPNTTDRGYGSPSGHSEDWSWWLTEIINIPEVLLIDATGDDLLSIYMDEILAGKFHLHQKPQIIRQIPHPPPWDGSVHMDNHSQEDDSDIQIWSGHSSRKSVQPLERIIYSHFNDDSCYANSNGFGDNYDEFMSKQISCVRYFNKRESREDSPYLSKDRNAINAIITNISPKKFIENEFDIDLCSVWFDGERLNPTFRHGLFRRLFHKQLTIQPNAIDHVCRCLENGDCRIVRNFHQRRKKYIDRKFLVKAMVPFAFLSQLAE